MQGFVYLLCDGEKFKIGMTKQKDIYMRISELQTGNPNEIFLSAYHKTNYPYKIEQMLHKRYFATNIKNEWFSMTSEDVAKFENECRYCESIINSLKDNPFMI